MILLFQENPTSADPAIIVRGWRFEAHLSKILTFFLSFMCRGGPSNYLFQLRLKLSRLVGAKIFSKMNCSSAYSYITYST